MGGYGAGGHPPVQVRYHEAEARQGSQGDPRAQEQGEQERQEQGQVHRAGRRDGRRRLIPLVLPPIGAAAAVLGAVGTWAARLSRVPAPCRRSLGYAESAYLA